MKLVSKPIFFDDSNSEAAVDSLSEKGKEIVNVEPPKILDSRVSRILHFQKRKLVCGHVVIKFGSPAMTTLLTKLEARGWSHLFLQGDLQQKFGKSKVYEFYTNGTERGDLLFTTVRGVPIHLAAKDIARILHVPMGGWGHYVQFGWPSLYNLASTLDISRKFSGDP